MNASCPHCAGLVVALPELQGRTVTCAHCGRQFEMPRLTAAAPPAGQPPRAYSPPPPAHPAPPQAHSAPAARPAAPRATPVRSAAPPAAKPAYPCPAPRPAAPGGGGPAETIAQRHRASRRTKVSGVAITIITCVLIVLVIPCCLLGFYLFGLTESSMEEISQQRQEAVKMADQALSRHGLKAISEETFAEDTNSGRIISGNCVDDGDGLRHSFVVRYSKKESGTTVTWTLDSVDVDGRQIFPPP